LGLTVKHLMQPTPAENVSWARPPQRKRERDDGNIDMNRITDRAQKAELSRQYELKRTLNKGLRLGT